MKIAATYQNGKIFEHFGHTEEFKLYEIQSDKIKKTEIVTAAGSGHGALAEFLKAKGVDVLICGGIGAGAQNALKDAGIRLYGGVCGNADKAVEAFIRGNLNYNPDIQCNHHGHGHEGGESGGCGRHGSCGGRRR